MSYYFPTSNCGGDAIPDYTCNPCVTPEFGRVRSVALVHSSYVATLQANPTNETLWTTGVDTGVVYAVYKTQGSYDGEPPLNFRALAITLPATGTPPTSLPIVTRTTAITATSTTQFVNHLNIILFTGRRIISTSRAHL